MIEKIAFASPYCLVDFTSGAAVATCQALQFLARLGFRCQAFCGSLVDAPEEVLLEELLAAQGTAYEVRNAAIGHHQACMAFTSQGNVPVTVFRNGSSRGVWMSQGEIDAFLRAYAIFLDKNRPDVLLTYGGDPISETMIKLAKRRDIPVVFALHNFSYGDPASFAAVDYVVVPSEFSRQYHWEKLGLACHVLPNLIDWQRVEVRAKGDSPIFAASTANSKGQIPSAAKIGTVPNEVKGDSPIFATSSAVSEGQTPSAAKIGTVPNEAKGDSPIFATSMAVSKGQTPCAAKIGTVPGGCHPQYVTFVNPQATKGVFVFARIAEELARRRPDIPLLVVEGRGRAGLMKQAGIDLARLGNVRTMANTPDPREFYAVTKLLVMPSLWNESFGLVAAEAMINGIPVLASSRGALPETLGYGPHPGPLPEVEGAYLFDIPVQYTPQSRTLPAAEEVLPWVEMIERLWDDGEFYRQSSEAARARAECWRPERLAETYRQFFSSITPQPGPPIVPQHRAPDRAYGSSGPSISPHPA